MQILVVHNQKGGVGKTLVSAHAAWYFARKGSRVVLVDADVQANSTSMLEAFPRISDTAAFFKGEMTLPHETGKLGVIPAVPEISTLKRSGENLLPAVRRSVALLQDHFDVMIVDTGPDDSTLNMYLLCVATHVLAPIDLSAHSIQGMKTLLQRIVGVRQKLNTSLHFLGILVNGLDRSKNAHVASLDTLLSTYNAKYFMPQVLTHRNAFHEAASTRRPVWEDRKRAAFDAAREMRAVLEHVDAVMFGQSDQTTDQFSSDGEGDHGL